MKLRVGDPIEVLFFRFGGGPWARFPADGIGSARGNPEVKWFPARVHTLTEGYAFIIELESGAIATAHASCWMRDRDRTWRFPSKPTATA